MSNLIEEKAELRLLISLVQEEGYSVEKAAKRLGISVVEFEEILQQNVEDICQSDK